MNKTHHTPGPWVIYEPRLIIEDAEGNVIARIISEVGKPFNKANAHLIAAAPEMLEALIAVRRHGLIEQDGYDSIVRKVGAAIAKAEGREG